MHLARNTRRAVLIVALSLPAATAAIQPHETISVSDLARETAAHNNLKQMAATATALRRDADRLLMDANAKTSGATIAEQLRVLNTEANRMAGQIDATEAASAGMPLSDLDALNQSRDILRAIAINATCAIEYFNLNGEHLGTAAYGQFARNVELEANRVVKTLRDTLKYDQLPAK